MSTTEEDHNHLECVHKHSDQPEKKTIGISISFYFLNVVKHKCKVHLTIPSHVLIFYPARGNGVTKGAGNLD